METIVDSVELERVKIQTQLDATKTQLERNKLGQFATPTILATQMLQYAQSLMSSDTKLRFLDPAFGTGSFFSALLRTFPHIQVDKAVGYEIDSLYCQAANRIWCDTSLELHLADFTHTPPPNTDNSKYNLLICNPPYVRHHHIPKNEKQRLQKLGELVTGIKLSQQTGLYGHFLSLSHSWMAKNCIAGWLIPSEFMDVNYGQKVKEYLLHNVTLLRIHRFKSEDVQFADALVSSAVVWFINKAAGTNHDVEFTYGGTLAKPEVVALIPTNSLWSTTKWTKFPLRSVSSFNEEALRQHGADSTKEGTHAVTAIKTATHHAKSANEQDALLLSDMFEIKRGLATGANGFFLLNEQQIAKYQLPSKFLTPILPGPRYLSSSEVKAYENGNPILEHPLFLLSCNISEQEIRIEHPSLWKYLQIGIERGIHKNYLCSHRKLWYSQEKRPASLFVCSYIGRQDHKKENPFRFILNHSNATATNAYHILYPKPDLQKVLQNNARLAYLIWEALNSITQETLTSEGRVYGGGLYKMEPKELGNVVANNLFPLVERYLPITQATLL